MVRMLCDIPTDEDEKANVNACGILIIMDTLLYVPDCSINSNVN